jgi:glycopeptide antibiotics resistance protein
MTFTDRLNKLINWTLRLLPIAFWVYLIATILLAVLPINRAGELNDITIIRVRGDYFLHALMLIPWAIFRPSATFWRRTWLLWGLLFAAAIEGVQYLLPYRAFNINDLIANSIGILLGSLVLSLFLFAAK